MISRMLRKMVGIPLAFLTAAIMSGLALMVIGLSYFYGVMVWMASDELPEDP